jgi:hypothetical protein
MEKRGMTRKDANKILGDKFHVIKNNAGDDVLVNKGGHYLSYFPRFNNKHATLDGQFTADELEAIAFKMRELKKGL